MGELRKQSENLTTDTFKYLNSSIQELSKKLGANLRTNENDDPQKFNGALRPLNNNRWYMAFTRPEENLSQGYSGLSFVIFPIKAVKDATDNLKYTCVVSICIGTSDLGEDEDLAALPYLRRSYTKLIPKDKSDRGFIKTSFTDTVSESTSLFKYLEEGRQFSGWELSEISDYKKFLPAAIVLTFDNKDIDQAIADINKGLEVKYDNDFVVLASWLAQYAKIRGWEFRNNKNNRYNLQDNLVSAVAKKEQETDDSIETELKNILESDKFMVIQGAPGTGKTRAALRLGKKNGYHVFFTQFHADTTYADFVGGIRPVLNSDKVSYTYKEGILTEAIAWAKDHSDKKALLIIDEINRANLQNVVGPMFYLFERNVNEETSERDEANIILERAEGKTIELSSLPKNLMVVATMNTSDRSLAIVDFALRRRFVWYTMPVLNLGEKDFGIKYNENLFLKISELFDKYATDEELSLQPGHSYFIAPNEEAMKHRLEYEIMPLMKEYFANGLMLGARNEFADLYFREIGKFMYR